MADDERGPRPVPRRSSRRIYVPPLIVVIVLCLGPPVGAVVYRTVVRSAAQSELDRLRLPETWKAISDTYRGPTLGGARYASFTRDYWGLPDPPDAIIQTATRLVAEAGWSVGASEPADTLEAPPCDHYPRCWSKGKYRLYLTVTQYRAPETEPEYRPYATCPNPPNTMCAEAEFQITYVPLMPW